MNNKNETLDTTPVMPGVVFDYAPGFIDGIVSPFTAYPEREIVLKGSLITLGVCLNKIHAWYRKDAVIRRYSSYVPKTFTIIKKGTQNAIKNKLNAN
jgi:hypothetical protein